MQTTQKRNIEDAWRHVGRIVRTFSKDETNALNISGMRGMLPLKRETLDSPYILPTTEETFNKIAFSINPCITEDRPFPWRESPARHLHILMPRARNLVPCDNALPRRINRISTINFKGPNSTSPVNLTGKKLTKNQRHYLDKTQAISSSTIHILHQSQHRHYLCIVAH